MFTKTESKIIDLLRNKPLISSKEIHNNMASNISYATLKRNLKKLISYNYIETKGNGKSTKYLISQAFELIQPIDIDNYFEKEIDERRIKEHFNLHLITDLLSHQKVFTIKEIDYLNDLQSVYKSNISQLSESEYKKELERLAIDLSWKSSQIEGNTYSLLETERLLKEKETASGKTKEEASMLLNHKETLDFIIDKTDYFNQLTVSKIEDMHTLLTKELSVERNLRKRRIGITGTKYRPLDNEFQILEALKSACELINNKDNIFEKAILALVLISYIQPFMDGNKRTARIVSNAILMNNKHCPLSFRTVDSIDYKKAILLFYEQNNISAFKNIFIKQFEFAVNTYF